jgi:hypothetical protein
VWRRPHIQVIFEFIKILNISIEIYSRKLIAPLSRIKATILSLVLPKFLIFLAQRIPFGMLRLERVCERHF